MKNIFSPTKSKRFADKKGVILGGVARPDQRAFDTEEFRNQPDVAKHLENLLLLVKEIDSNTDTKFQELKNGEIIDLTVLGDYKCPFCVIHGSTSEIIEHIQKCAQEVCKSENKYAIPTMMTTNPFLALQNGLEVLRKYLQNIITNPQDKKFHTIRTSNRVFVEKVKPLICHHEVISFFGFELKESIASDIVEIVYKIENPNVEHLKTCMSLLELENKVYPILSRGLKKYLTFDTKVDVDENDKDLEITVSDLNDQIRRRRDETMENSVLKFRPTKVDEISNSLLILKIRLPDSSIIQGKFYTNETCDEVYRFILRNLYRPKIEFILQTSHIGCQQKLIFCNDSSLSSNDIKEGAWLYLRIISKNPPSILLNNSSVELLSNISHFKNFLYSYELINMLSKM